MKWHIPLIFILVLLAGFWLAQTTQEEKTSDISENPLLAKIKSVVTGDSAPEVKPQAVVQTPTIVKEVEIWVQTEAAKMDTTTYDSAREESVLRQRAQSLSFAEIQTFKVIALDKNRTANERIFSAYMLSMTSNQGLSAIQDLAKAPLSNPGEKTPHSLEETQDMHEKALRRMGIDELFNRAQRDPSYVPELAKEIEQISVPELKAYAQERFQQLFG